MILVFNSAGSVVASWGGSGTGDGEFEQLRGIAIDHGGHIYVTDSIRNDVQEFAW